MAVLMFWNVAKLARADAIGHLCRQHDVDLLLLAEAGDAPPSLSAQINVAGGLTAALWELPRLDSRIRAYTRYPPGYVAPAFDDRHVKMLNLRPPVGFPVLVVAAHLPSKLHADPEDQRYRLRQLRADIERQEVHNGHQNTLVIGDLNVNPFEDSLTAADGLHGVMDKAIAKRPARTVQGRKWDYFYNPMWSRLGDDSVGPPGTHWYAGSGLVTHFWNTFDQVLLRPGLLSSFDPSNLIVPDTIDGTPILRRTEGGAGLSDHLPLILHLDIERSAESG